MTACAAILLGAAPIFADEPAKDEPAKSDPQLIHADQSTYTRLVEEGKHEEAFEQSFEEGDELFETVFNSADGVGANVGEGRRFSRLPRADLAGPKEWASHMPMRSTGPNAQACNSCHNKPFDDGAGSVANNVQRDPMHAGTADAIITRNAPHLFGMGAVQRLAEEMTTELELRQQAAIEESCRTGGMVSKSLVAKGVDFGVIHVKRTNESPCEYSVDTASITGVDSDLVVRPFHWKGKDATIRAFNVDASHNELGMQAVELVGMGVDGDGDGVVNEMTVGDQTALAIYLAAQPRPVTMLELEALGHIDPLDQDQRRAIVNGESLFVDTGCGSCHTPQMRLDDPVYHEPSQHEAYRNATFVTGKTQKSFGLDPARAVSFDLTRDHPDNIIETDDGEVHQIGSFEADGQGGAIVRLFSDLKRHEMGPELAENIDETGVGKSVWLTRGLWGVGSTSPYLHDGRATTLAEAILAHGGEALDSRKAFEALSDKDQTSLIAFLDNLVLYKIEEEEEDSAEADGNHGEGKPSIAP